MTYLEFLEALRKTPRDWNVEGVCIRRGSGQCPISALVGIGCKEYASAAKQLGIPMDLAEQIIFAADGYPLVIGIWDQWRIRRDLIEACGLTGAEPHVTP